MVNVNVRGFLSKAAELSAYLEIIGMLSFVALTETHLNDYINDIILPGYTLISRRDRIDGRQGGGVALFALDKVAEQIVHVGDSDVYKRSWHIFALQCGTFIGRSVVSSTMSRRS